MDTGVGASISVIIPCLNEEKNLPGAIESVYRALASSGRFGDVEILIFNDFSTDGTREVAEGLGKKDRRIRVIHNKRNMGFGYNYTEGVRLSRNEYVIMVPGDNEIPADAIERIFSHAGEADIIIPYTANPRVRAFSRRALSRLFVAMMNALFGLRLRYYNGTCLIRGSLLKGCPMKTRGFAYMAAILVRLLKGGASFLEAGVDIKPREAGKTKAFRLKNIASVAAAVADLFWEVRVRDRSLYRAPLKRIEAVSGAGRKAL